MPFLFEDKDAWQQAENKNTIESYNQYLNLYPQGIFFKTAKNKKQQLEEEMIIFPKWEKVKQTNTYAAYKEFYNTYPKSSYGANEPQRIVYFIGNQRYEEVYPKYELLTSHCGRRTFIINALYLGINAEVIMKWTGHNDYKSMKPYIVSPRKPTLSHYYISQKRTSSLIII